MNEARYQKKLIDKLEVMFPGCYISKNDPRSRQGVPDILILFNDNWGMLEVKMANDSDVQPNQSHYVNVFNEMSFASFINPQNEEQVLNDLQHALGVA